MNQQRILLVGVWLALVTVSSSIAQMPKLPRIKQFGIDGFRLMLQQQGLRATQSQVGTALDSPDETVAIILGDLSSVTRISRQLNEFVDNGGSLLIASDLRGVDILRTPICGAWIKSTQLLSGSEKNRFGFRGYSDCPIVTEFDRNREPELFDGIETLVTNRPSEVDCTGRVRRVALLPSRHKPPLMVTYHKQKGRMLFVADHSIFINEMLVHGDNARFVSNSTHWLCDGGNRTKLVLINDGQVLPDWSFGETPPAIPLDRLLRAVQRGGLQNLPIGDSVLPIVNESVGRFQRENGFNNVTRRVAHAVIGQRAVRIAMLLLGFALLLNLFRWLLLTKSRLGRWLSFQDWSQPSEPKLVGAIRDQHYAPYLRTLTREFFIEAGADSIKATPQPVVHTSQILAKGKMGRDVLRIWRIATSSRRLPMSKKKFAQALKLLRDLRQLQLAGDLRIEWPTTTTSTK